MLQGIKSYLNRVHQRHKSLRAGRERTIYEIVHDANGMKVSWLTLENETGETTIEWRGVVALFTFKRDLFAFDSICLCFSLDDEKSVEINEQMGGFAALGRHLPEYLEGCERFEDWFDTVAQPPFQTNWMQIYKRIA